MALAIGPKRGTSLADSVYGLGGRHVQKDDGEDDDGGDDGDQRRVFSESSSFCLALLPHPS